MTSIITQEIQVYLDSDSATQGTTNLSQTSDGNYTFQISPPIATKSHLEKNYIFLRDFSCLNTMANIPAQTFTVRVFSTGVGEILYTRTFNEQNITSIEELVAKLNAKFSPGSMHITDENDEDYGNGTTNVPHLGFNYDKGTGIVTVKDDAAGTPPTRFFKCVGPVFDLLNFPDDFVTGATLISPTSEFLRTRGKTIGEINDHVSSQPPVNLYKQNLYLTCNQLLDSNPHTNNEVPNKLQKIKIDVDYGSYLQYQATQPVMKCHLIGQVINQLTFRIYDDDYNLFKPDRFFLTIAMETHKAIVEHPKSYWVKDTTNSLIQEQYDSRHPPIDYQHPNDRCPQTNRY